jgi:non-specific serine/threonine protein kinase
VVERADAGSRYRFLETVRQFALEELNTAGEGAATRNRHLKTFELLAQEAESGLLGPDQANWLRRLESEHGNLLAALDWCASADDGAARGLAFAAAVSRFWSARGYYELGWTSLKTALERDTEARPTPARGKALVRAGGLALYRGDYAAARPLIEASLEIHRAEGDEKGEARALSGVGTVATYQGDFDRARTAIEESLALYRKHGNKRGEATALHNIGYIAVRQGLPGEARRLFGEALAIARTVGDFEVVALTLSAAALAALHEGDLPAARAMLIESLDRALELGARREGAYALEAAAELSRADGNPALAARLSGASEALRTAMGSPLVPVEEGERKEFLARIESDLGAERTAQELAGGRGLGFAEAVALAREGLPAAP